MDVLSDVLREVRLTGAVYFDVHAGAPWVATTPGSASICAGVMPEFDHVIGFHIVLDGRGWAQLVDDSRPAICLDVGDAVIIARGDGHSMSDARPYNPVLEALPRILHVRRASAAGILTFDLMRSALEESQQPRAGGEAILAKISELMFLHAVRQYIDSLPEESTGWLAGLRDRHVGAALRAMHARPAHPWTLDALGREAGLSRTVFSQRFAEVMGMPAIQYLSKWRLQLAAGLLDRQGMSIAGIADAVGFGSEAAFNRAFKREVGTPPGAWRRRARRESS
jgi:AraC-like DNA-binding protein